MSLQVMWSRESFWAFGASETNLVINISSSKPGTVINICPHSTAKPTTVKPACQESRKSSAERLRILFLDPERSRRNHVLLSKHFFTVYISRALRVSEACRGMFDNKWFCFVHYHSNDFHFPWQSFSDSLVRPFLCVRSKMLLEITQSSKELRAVAAVERFSIV